MLATVALTVALSMPLPQAPETPACPWHDSSSTEALAQSLMHIDKVCMSHAVGYVEGIFDAGVGTLFAAPKDAQNLTALRIYFLTAYQDGRLRGDSFAGSALVYVFRMKFGEVNDEDVHER